MVSLRGQLVREVSALYGFVDSIAIPCVPPPQTSSFTESSGTFFEHIDHLAKATKKYLTGFPIDRAVNGSDDDFLESRDELWTIRSAWRALHQFIKPAADADTLNQPTAMQWFRRWLIASE